jgi:hypothetical protein
MASDWAAGDNSHGSTVAKSKININPNHETLHSVVGVPEGQKLTASQKAIKPGDTPAVRKKKQFAINAAKWGK